MHQGIDKQDKRQAKTWHGRRHQGLKAENAHDDRHKGRLMASIDAITHTRTSKNGDEIDDRPSY